MSDTALNTTDGRGMGSDVNNKENETPIGNSPKVGAVENLMLAKTVAHAVESTGNVSISGTSGLVWRRTRSRKRPGSPEDYREHHELQARSLVGFSSQYSDQQACCRY